MIPNIKGALSISEIQQKLCTVSLPVLQLRRFPGSALRPGEDTKSEVATGRQAWGLSVACIG